MVKCPLGCQLCYHFACTSVCCWNSSHVPHLMWFFSSKSNSRSICWFICSICCPLFRSPEGFHLQNSESKFSSARETHSRSSLRTLRSISTSFTTSFDRLTSFGNIRFDQEVKSKGLGYLKSIVDKNPLFLHLWNEILVMLCVIATSLDPLFCYTLLVDESKRCVEFDKKLRTVVVIFRSITDFFYIFLIVCHFHFGYSSFYNENPDDADDGVCTRAWRFLFSYFTVDVLSVLPLPQVWNSSLCRLRFYQ